MMTEHAEQCALFEWAALYSRQVPELEMLFAIPNGGFRHKATAGRLKAEGLKPGIPDMMFAVPRGPYHGAFIELKVGRNKPTKLQKQCHLNLRAQGYFVAVCYGCWEAMDTLKGYLALEVT